MSELRYQLLASIIALLLFSSLAGCGQDPVDTKVSAPPAPPPPEELTDLDPKGVALINKYYAQAVQSPDNWQARLNLAKSYHTHTLWEPSLQAYQQAMEMAPDQAVISHLMSLLYMSKNDPAAGIESMRRTIALQPSYIPAQYLLAMELRDQGYFEQAAAIAQKAVERVEVQLQQHPDDQSVLEVAQAARLAYAVILLDIDQPRLAALQGKHAIEADPRNRYAFFVYGTAMRRLGDEDGANRYLQLGQGAEPQWIDPWSGELRDFQVGYQADLVRANHYLNTGEPKKALTFLLPYYDDNPDDVVVLATLARGYRVSGNLEIATRLLRKAIQLDPNHFESRLIFVGLYRELLPSLDQAARNQQLNEALVHADKAIELRPTSSNAYAVKADLLYSVGEFSQAADLYREAARLDEERRGLERQAAIVLTKAGRWEEAVEIFQQIASLYPDDVQVLKELAEAQLGAGQVEQARQTLTQIETVEPSSSVIAPLRAAINQAAP